MSVRSGKPPQRPRRMGDLIETPPVRTVVRLAEGRERPEETCGGFVLTDEVQRHLHALAEGLLQDPGKGIFLRGDFGSGKSHFLAALSAWLDGAGCPAQGAPRGPADVLTQAHPGLARLAASGRRFLPVPVSLIDYRAARPLEEILITETERALESRGIKAELTPRARFLVHLRETLRAPRLAEAFAAAAGTTVEQIGDWIEEDGRRAYAAGWRFLKEQGIESPQALVEEKAETLARALAAVRGQGFHGLIFLIDELSEFLLSKPDAAHRNDDARTLQLLGETADHAPLWIIAAVQESIEASGDIASPTLRKIKDRYPVLLRLSTLHIRDLIERRLVKKKPGADEEVYRIWQAYRTNFPAFACEHDLFRRIYPVHPTTLSLLEGLGALFSQHRGIVDFVHARLAGDPRRGIVGILDRPAGELLAPDAIYDHFSGRLAEFSDFNLYPRHLVPHLDETIDRTLPQPSDRALARRLVRILVLYAIHPSAEPPTARALAEMTGCMLAAHDPDLNAGFVARTLLDPLVERTSHLVRRPGATDDPLDAVYALSAERDHGRTLSARIERAAAEIDPADPRVLADLLARLPSSVAWPAPFGDAAYGEGPLKRQVSWRGGVRQALIVWAEPGAEEELRQEVGREIDSGKADFAVVLSIADVPSPSPHAAVWKVGAPQGGDAETLREYAAVSRVAASLSPDNPADAPLIAPAREKLARLEPLAQAAALGAVYAGAFLGRDLPPGKASLLAGNASLLVDPAARQMRRFQRILEVAAAALLEERYPRYQEIETRAAAPSARLYQRLLDELIVPGSVTLSAARAAGLGEAIEGLAVPLGLVEVRAGAYRVAPDPAGRPFLTHFFGLLRASAPVPLAEVRRALASGPYGVPEATADFLFVALAHAGLVSLLSGGRRLPLEFLNLSALDRGLAIAPGETIGREDRETLLGQCAFLAPAGGWEAFGLRQQREAWQAAVKFRDRAMSLADDVEREAAKAARSSPFAGFGLEDLSGRARRIREVADEVKPSLSTREGLERFLSAWRRQAPEEEDLTLLERARDFLRDAGEEFLFIGYYVRHAAVERAVRDQQAGSARSPRLAELAREVRGLLDRPREAVLPDAGRGLKAAFGEFRAAYIEGYRSAHAARASASAPPALSRTARRAVELLRRLSGVEALDRPAGMEALFARIEGPGRPVCHADLDAELLRSPVCGCGFVPGDRPEEEPPASDPEAAIEESLRAYADILAAPRVLEALRARAFARSDMDAKGASRLRDLAELLADPERATAAALLDRLDESTAGEIARALAGMTRVERRSLAALVHPLAGRRLTPSRVLAQVREWVGAASEESILSIEDDSVAGAGAPGRRAAAPTGWWPRLHGGLFAEALPPDEEVAREAEALARLLEERFPSASLAPRLARLDVAGLWGFVAGEPVHTSALRVAWELLAERVLADPRAASSLDAESVHVHPEVASAVRLRLSALREHSEWEGAEFPARLRDRIALARVLGDPWAHAPLQQAAERSVGRLSEAAEDWLASLPPVEPIDLGRPSVVVVVDGVPPDVWLSAEGALSAAGPAPATTWRRLDAAPQTVPGLLALFGWPQDRDPVEEFARRGVPYESVEGNESRPLVDLLPPLPAGRSRVVRLALLDRAAHHGTARLDEMPALLATMLARHLPGLVVDARKHGRALVLTTDHGQGLTRKGLSHGRGGVFERAVFRVEWPA